jgi:hypothetical protein
MFAALYLRAGHLVPVLAVAHAVPEGQVIESNDLETLRVSPTPGLNAIPARDVDRVIGRSATELLEPGTLVAQSDLSEGDPIPPGSAVVGVAFSLSQLPAGGVAVGEDVDVILTGQRNAPDSEGSSDPTATTPDAGGAGMAGVPGSILVGDAEVVQSSLPSASSSDDDAAVVSLEVPANVGPSIAAASAAGQVALIVVSPLQ